MPRTEQEMLINPDHCFFFLFFFFFFVVVLFAYLVAANEVLLMFEVSLFLTYKVSWKRDRLFVA